jgi:hypothetical protein
MTHLYTICTKMGQAGAPGEPDLKCEEFVIRGRVDETTLAGV